LAKSRGRELDQWGGMLLVTRQAADAYAARFLRPAGFIEFSGARDSKIAFPSRHWHE
jgi:hypothetical protein